MTNRPAWAEFFNISESVLLSIKTTNDFMSSVSLFLHNQTISVEKYLSWAQEHFELVRLNDQFKISPEYFSFFKNWSNKLSCRRDFLPLAEWEDILYIACLEPRLDLNIESIAQKKVCFVLASPDQLDSLWQTSHPAQATETSQTAESAQPPPLKIQESFSPPSLDAPDGLSLSLPYEAPPPLIEPEGLFVKQPLAKVENKAANDLASLMPEGLSAALTESLPESMPENTVTQYVKPAPLKVATTSQNQVPHNNSKAFGDAFFSELKEHFKSCFAFEIQNEVLVPFAWDDNWKAPSADKMNISLSKASAFRVAYRTKMPYLGHVVETPTNMEFFKNWGLEGQPEMILVQPIRYDEKIVGLLLLTADKSKNQNSLLRHAEQSAERMAQALYSQTSLSSKAA